MQKKNRAKQIPRISQAEWEVMKVVWKQSPTTAVDIIGALQETGDWHPKTTKTLLGRLVKKGVLRYEQQGRAYLYEPLFNEEECIQAETNSFLQRFFSGSLKPMLAYFVENRKMSSAELRELKRLLDEKQE